DNLFDRREVEASRKEMLLEASTKSLLVFRIQTSRVFLRRLKGRGRLIDTRRRFGREIPIYSFGEQLVSDEASPTWLQSGSCLNPGFGKCRVVDQPQFDQPGDRRIDSVR